MGRLELPDLTWTMLEAVQRIGLLTNLFAWPMRYRQQYRQIDGPVFRDKDLSRERNEAVGRLDLG
jgi:hypothetical protein